MRIAAFTLVLVVSQAALSQTALEWVNTIGVNGFDETSAVAVDATGAIYAGGDFVGTVDFDPGPGVEELTATIEDPYLVKYDGSGTLVWARHLPGRGKITDIAVDGNDDVLVLGEFSASLQIDATLTLTATSGRDIFLIKFDAGGNRIWGLSFGGDGDDLPQDLALDSTDHVIVSGTIRISADLDPGPGEFTVTADIDEDAFVAKYDSGGSLVWGELFEQMMPSGIAQSDSARGLVVDATDSVYVGGLFGGRVDFGGTVVDAGGTDAYLAKLNAAGAVQWVIGTESPDLRTEHFALGIDQAGNLYAAGLYFGEPDFDPDPIDEAPGNSNGTLDGYLVSYDANGDFRWVSLLASDGTFEVFDLLVRPDGTSTIAGQFGGTADFDPGPDTEQRAAIAFSDAFFAHYDAGGNLISAQHLEGSPSFGGDRSGVQALAGAAGGDLLAAGSFRLRVDFDPGPGEEGIVPAGGTDGFVARYGEPLPPIVFADGFEVP